MNHLNSQRHTRNPDLFLLESILVGLLLWMATGSLRADQVVFSEIMFHPRLQDAPEWVEITNLTATPFDCAQWKLKGDDLEYTFTDFDRSRPRDSFIRPFERIILTGIPPQQFREMHDLPETVRIWGPWQGGFDRKKDKLILEDKNGIALCSLRFAGKPPWPVEAAGAGHTLVLTNPDRSVDDWRNWEASDQPGGTPGTRPFPKEGIIFQTQTSKEAFTRKLMVPMDFLWRYHPGNAKVPTNWMQPEFNDRDWKTGQALLGFEDQALPRPGIQTQLDKDPISYCFRTTFELAAVPQEGFLELNQILDDGAVYYLNGKRIATSRMPNLRRNGNLQTMASQTVSNAVLEEGVWRIGVELLREGPNVLAVSVHQPNNNSSDLVFGAELWMMAPKEAFPLRITEIGIAPDDMGYAVVRNTSDQAVTLTEHTMIVTSPAGQAPFVIASLPRETLDPDGSIRVSFNQATPLDAVLSLETQNKSILGTEITLQLPGQGFRQRWVDLSSRTWILEAMRAPSEAGLASPEKGNLSINEVQLSESSDSLKVELALTGNETVTLDQLALASSPDLSASIELQGSLGVGTYPVHELEWHTSYENPVTLYLYHMGSKAVLDAVSVELEPGWNLQRMHGSPAEWFRSDTPSLGQANHIETNPSIVINEIMYDPPFGKADLEFIELFHRGTQPQPLDGWKLEGGIEYEFPDRTIMQPGEYLVIADKPERWNEFHPDLAVLGPLKGKLSNTGERLRLLDARGNLADEVDYLTEGDWPELARGNGSSMELLHPDLDNAHSSAWKDSRQSRSAAFQTFKFTTRYRGHQQSWHPMDYQELHLYLVGESHVVLRNIQFREVGTTRNLLAHPDRMSVEGDSSTGWLIQGNHADSYMENGRLHLVAHGHGDNRANRAEIDITELKIGTEYEVEFEARWVQGSPRLIVRTWENSLSESVLLPIPDQLGTPGKSNSRRLPHPPPLVEHLKHEPAVPAPNERLTVEASVGWTADPGIVHLVYRPDGSPDAAWERTVMERTDSNPSDHSTLTHYRTTLEPNFSQGDLIQYYVEALPPAGRRTTLPRGAASRPALCVFDGRSLPNDLRVVRLLISEHDANAITRGESEAYGFRYPRLSNQYFNATFISNEKDIYHGAELRASGSPWTRQHSLARGKWRLPKDRLFREHGKFAFDNDPTRQGGAYRHHNRIARYLLYLLGHVSGENEFIYVVINAGQIQLREDVEPVDADYLNRNFKDGNQGELYRVDDDWWMSDHWSQRNRDANWNYHNTDHPALYRHSWMKRSSEEADDYEALISFFKLINRRDYSQEEVESVLDAESMLKMTAVLGYIADWDTFTQSRGKNAYFYRRPDDGKFQLLQWDADLSFGGRRHHAFYGGSRQFKQWVQQDYNYPRLVSYLNELVALTRDRKSRVEAWMFEETQGSPQIRVNAPFYRQFFRNRSRQVNQLDR